MNAFLKSCVFASTLSFSILSHGFTMPTKPKVPTLKTNVIYKGKDVAADGTSWKNVVQVQTDRSACTATIIGNQSILTAAHCVQGATENVYINFFRGSEIANTLSFSKGEFKISTLAWDKNDYDNANRDLAVITVNKVITDSDYQIMYYVTSDLDDRLNIRQPVYMIGAGTTGFDKNSGTLRFTQGTIDGYIGDTIQIRGNGGTGICAGDSGGPVAIKANGEFRLVGVLSDYRTELDNLSGDLCTPGGSYTFMTERKVNWMQAKVTAQEAELPAQ